MNLYEIGQRLKVHFAKKTKFGFRATVPQQMKYFNKLSDANDDLERSYLQYKCRCAYENGFVYKIIRIIGNLISPFVLIYILFKKYNSDIDSLDYDAFINFSAKNSDLIGDCILNKYKRILFLDDISGSYLSYDDKKYVMRIFKRYPFSPMFVLKNALKIRFYSYIILLTNGADIVTISEYSYTSSILTNYCEKNSINHINVQHGEAIRNIARCYFRFSACYVWDEYYIELFCSLRADENQFKIDVPSALKIDVNKRDIKVKYKYYASRQDENELCTIKSNLEKLGENYMIRPHPIWTDISILESVFSKEVIENPNMVTIKDSLLETEFVMSQESTVMFQAYCNNIGVVIDDLSHRERYNQLVQGDYIMIKLPHLLLSNLLLEAAI